MIDIHTTNSLTPVEIEQVKVLFALCKERDGLKGDVLLNCELNFYPAMNCFFLLYEDGALASFLSLFAPDSGEAEVSAYTCPDRRKKGYFSALLKRAVEELKTYRVNEVLFVHEPHSRDAQAILRKFGAALEHSEFLLGYGGGEPKEPLPGMTLSRAARERASTLTELNVQIFGDDRAMSESMVQKALCSDVIEYYVAEVGGEAVGLVNVNFENEEVSIFGLGISPAHQGKGYGSSMLSLLLRLLLARGCRAIALEVDSTNERAYRLYTGMGFLTRARFDYYRLAL